ncbi:MAG: hypothetical protein ACXV5Q_09650 [Frankiaceae bacterium]
MDWGLRAALAAALGYSGWVHWHLHDLYDANATSVLSQGDLFLAQAIVAWLVAAAVLLLGGHPLWGRVAWLAALVVGAVSLAAVLTSVYVDIGRVGIVPSMYEPIWTTEKAWSAVAEGTAAALAALRLALPLLRRAAPGSG